MSDALHQISILAQLLAAAQARVESINLELATAKEEVRRLEQEDIPLLMKEAELIEFKLEDGSKVTVKDEVQCAITEANRAAAHAWLTKLGFDGIIKTTVSVFYDRDDRAAAREDADKIADATGRPAEVGESVHPQTLKAFIKERMADPEGPQPPAELFGIHPFSVAKITPPKKK